MSDAPKYSIITTSKGRWHHLVESLPVLLRQPDAEVIVVDYDCPDGTADNVERDFPTARVARVKGQPGFNVSHARNIGAAEARGETLVFVDADVVVSDRFIPLVDASLSDNAFAKPFTPTTPQENSLQGTCVIHKRHFDQIGGYDEVLRNYGGEDLELYERLWAARVNFMVLEREAFDRVIDHSQEERSRFFDQSSQLGFLVGKVYRVAKDIMVRMDGIENIELEIRQNLYDEVARLVGNMARMERKELSLEIRFPDGKKSGLHRKWEFHRSVWLTVRMRANEGGGEITIDRADVLT